MKLIEILTLNPNLKLKTLNPTTLLEQLAFVFTESEIRPTMNTHKLINYELECDLSNSYIPTEEEI